MGVRTPRPRRRGACAIFLRMLLSYVQVKIHAYYGSAGSSEAFDRQLETARRGGRRSAHAPRRASTRCGRCELGPPQHRGPRSGTGRRRYTLRSMPTWTPVVKEQAKTCGLTDYPSPSTKLSAAPNPLMPAPASTTIPAASRATRYHGAPAVGAPGCSGRATPKRRARCVTPRGAPGRGAPSAGRGARRMRDRCGRADPRGPGGPGRVRCRRDRYGTAISLLGLPARRIGAPRAADRQPAALLRPARVGVAVPGHAVVARHG